ncbi:3'(2'),5'-bisphosphate nucleotidase CysQ [Candidatus Parcubacteria bacterium]|nr:MAG: 3'(2'),5'-bisphosphate nucleotidase CysQ [Candidatus Parcubacteria bacterium]
MEKILEKVKEVVRRSGKEIMKNYGDDNEVTTKKDKTPVTEIDLLSEKIIIDGLSELGYGFLSEERLGSKDRLDDERIWVIDPIDGTKDFINQTGEFSVMVGLVENNESILGVVYQPAFDKLYFATKGGGAYLEEAGKIKKMNVSRTDDCGDIKMLASRYHMMDLEQNLSREMDITDFLSHGSAGLKIALIAEQKADLYINSSDRTAEWDICAADIIIREAGGMITDMNGSRIMYNKENYLNLKGYVVSNGLVHDKVLAKIKELR